MSTTNATVRVTDAHKGTVHLAMTTHFADGEFLSSALLISPTIARRLASALVEMADAADVAAAELVEVPA